MKFKERRVRHILYILPAILFLSLFFLYPIFDMLRRSVFDPEFTIEHYVRVFREPVYLHVMWITFKIAAIVTLATIVLGYPLAYFIHKSSRKIRVGLLLFILLPFWTSLLVRTYSWMIILQRQGVINCILQKFHIINEPLPMMFNLFGVLVGMIYMLLPYMVLPIYSIMEHINPLLLKSAEGLGARKRQVFWKIFFPLSTPGLFAGVILVFLLSLGFFITPALIGGRKEQMISMIIEKQVNELLNWSFASALSIILLLLTIGAGIGLYLIFRRSFRREEIFGLAQ